MTIRPASDWATGENGIICADVPDADYFAFPAVSNSLLSQPTPAHMRAYLDGTDTDTPSRAFGRAYHMGALQPMAYATRYAVPGECAAELKTGGGCTATGKVLVGGRWYCSRRGHAPDGVPADAGILPIGQADHDTIMAMSSALRDVPAIRNLIDLPGGFELSIRWEEDGVVCKARVDFVAPDHGVALDLKSARDASPDGFARAAANYRYNRQEAWYRRGLRAVGIDIRAFVFVAQEKAPPYAAAAYTIPDYAVAAGEAEAISRLVEYQASKDTGHWPAYGGANTIELDWPAWADERIENHEEDYYAS